jgi:hypothetical protein
VPRRSRVTIHEATLAELLTSAHGPVVREVTRVALRVEARIKQTSPRDKGQLAASFDHAVRVEGSRVIARVGSDSPVARYHSQGTGVYGPHRSPIVPTRRTYLKFPARGGGFVYARSVRGIPQNDWVVKALEAESPWPVRRNPAR